MLDEKRTRKFSQNETKRRWYVYAISPTGGLSWTLSLETVEYNSLQGTSFSPDGKTLYTRGKYNSLIAVDIDTKSIKWTFGG